MNPQRLILQQKFLTIKANTLHYFFLYARGSKSFSATASCNWSLEASHFHPWDLEQHCITEQSKITYRLAELIPTQLKPWELEYVAPKPNQTNTFLKIRSLAKMEQNVIPPSSFPWKVNNRGNANKCRCCFVCLFLNRRWDRKKHSFLNHPYYSLCLEYNGWFLY